LSEQSDSEASPVVPPPSRKSCGCWTVVFLSIIGATLFVVGVYAFWRWSNARGVERMIAVAREKGEPTTPEELSASYPTSPEIERTTRLWLRAMDEADLPYRSEDYYDVAIAGSGRPGDERSWTEMRRYREEGVMSPTIYAASKAYLAKMGDAVEVAREARLSGTTARFPLDHDVSEDAYIETIQSHRHLTNVLSLELEVRRHEGRVEGSGEILLTLLALAESARNHPAQVFQFVRFAEQGVARAQLMAALERRELANAEVIELQQAWSEVDLVPALRLMLLELQEDALHSLISPPFPYFAEDQRPCPEEDAYYAAGVMGRMLDRSDGLDPAEAEAEVIAEEFERVLQCPFGERRFAGSRGYVAAAVHHPTVLRRYQTWVDATVVVLVCERFRREQGDWPEDLGQLVPAYLEQIPPDRYGGGTLKYRRMDDSVAVYSVGDDGTDDGGAITENYLEEPSDLGVCLRTGRIRSEGH
jgi:hypothetical protein